MLITAMICHPPTALIRLDSFPFCAYTGSMSFHIVHGKISMFLNPESFRRKEYVADICKHRINKNVQMKYMLYFYGS
jgi:hypothetical protein